MRLHSIDKRFKTTGLFIKNERCATINYDFKEAGWTTIFDRKADAALDQFDSKAN